MKILEVENLTKLYKNKRGIESVSFSIEKGDTYGLLGPNGAGKTTAMKIITGLMRQQKGTVKIFGKSLEDNHEQCLSRMGSLIEAPSFVGYLTAGQNMKMAARYYGTSDEKIDEILNSMGLLKHKKERPEKFSLGMKQRMGLALALVGEPEFLVLDEPANGLDIEGMVEIRRIILKLREKSETTFLISSHLANEIEKTCTKVAIMYQSRLVAESTMEYVLQNFPSVEDYFLHVVEGSRKEVLS